MGLRDGASSDMGIDRAKLSALTGHPVSELDRIAVTVTDQRYRLLGHSLTQSEILATSAKFCPLCVREKGFVELHFQLTLMIGCPEHKCVALTACPKCGEAPRWNRPGLLECHCSHQLSHCGLEPLSSSETLLLELIRRKALGLPQSGTIANGFPAEALAAMDLHRLLSIIRLFGRYRLIGFGQDGPSSDAAILKAAATLLRDWPKGLHDLMIDLGFSYRTRRSSKVRTMQESFLDALALMAR
jgi:TniQ